METEALSKTIAGPRSEVWNQDCMELLATLPDKSVDLAVVDPPYGIDINKSGVLIKDKGLAYKPWDKSAPDKEYFQELFRVAKNAVIWGANHFIERIPYPSKYWLVWDKMRPETFSFAQCELAWTSFNTPAKVFHYSINSQLHSEIRIHPTQKPVALYAWIYRLFAKKGDLILDTHLGSSSSRIAAFKMGLDFIGCEIDPEFVAASEARFQKECRGRVVENGQTIEQYQLFNEL